MKSWRSPQSNNSHSRAPSRAMLLTPMATICHGNHSSHPDDRAYVGSASRSSNDDIERLKRLAKKRNCNAVDGISRAQCR